MFNANEARKMTNEFKANEIAKMNEYANYHAEAICEEIAINAKQGREYITWTIQGDLESLDMRARVCTILKNNGFGVNVRKGYIFISW